MLRRPSALCATPREEGCSSTAIDLLAIATPAVWNNLADRDSAGVAIANKSAVP
jgi:hypothetical protein